jgi:transcriptional regulator with XRE-family HTH domain
VPKRRRYSSEPFGVAIARLMNESGVTYRGLAAKTELSAGYINHLVHGNRPVPSNAVIARLAEALSIDADHFVEYRMRIIAERLAESPELVDRLYRRLSS